MRQWDLTTSHARLKLAMDDLRHARHEISLLWDDPMWYQVENDFLLPLEPLVAQALDAAGRLDDVLTQAQRECDDR